MKANNLERRLIASQNDWANLEQFFESIIGSHPDSFVLVESLRLSAEQQEDESSNPNLTDKQIIDFVTNLLNEISVS